MRAASRPAKGHLNAYLLGIATFVCVACRVPERRLPEVSPPYVCLPNGRDPLHPDRISSLFIDMPNGLLHHILEKRPGPLDVLEISGGAQNGAFGAGILSGWTQSGQRPEFDVVTGISVGALIATHAFLGRPEDDLKLKEIFTTTTQRDVLVRRRIIRMWDSASVYDSAPLGRLIEKYIDMEILNRVADEADKGRRLLVGAVNLDTKQIWVWDLTGVAGARTESARDLYRRILLAASSPPIVMPPVEIGGFYFTDGGIRDRLLVAGLSMAEQVGSLQGRDAVEGHVYVIFNDKMVLENEAVSTDMGGVLTSGIQVMLNGQMETTLERSYFMARAWGLQFRLQVIPEFYGLGDDPLAFDQRLMRDLFELGSRMGADATSWMKAPPPSQNLSPWMIQMLDRLGESRP